MIPENHSPNQAGPAWSGWAPAAHRVFCGFSAEGPCAARNPGCGLHRGGHHRRADGRSVDAGAGESPAGTRAVGGRRPRTCAGVLRGWCGAPTGGGQLDRGPRRVVARAGGNVRPTRTKAQGVRTPEEPLLHHVPTSGTTGVAKGNPCTPPGRYLKAGCLHPQDGFDLKAGTPTIYWLCRGHRLGHRAATLATVYRAAGQTGPPRSCRGHADTRRNQDRWWKIIEEFKVSILYTAPTIAGQR